LDLKTLFLHISSEIINTLKLLLFSIQNHI